MNLLTIFQIVSLIIIVIIHVFIIHWLNKMNSCKCSSNFSEKKYLYEWFIFMIIWLIIFHLILISNGGGLISTPITILNSTLGFINLVMIIRLFIYLRKLRETNCNCGTLKELNTIYYYLIIVFSILAIYIIIMIIAGIYIAVIFSSLTTKKTLAKSNKNKSIK
jgi:hypothetical protein